MLVSFDGTSHLCCYLVRLLSSAHKPCLPSRSSLLFPSLRLPTQQKRQFLNFFSCPGAPPSASRLPAVRGGLPTAFETYNIGGRLSPPLQLQALQRSPSGSRAVQNHTTVLATTAAIKWRAPRRPTQIAGPVCGFAGTGPVRVESRLVDTFQPGEASRQARLP
jgi:hypothetical protein